MAATILRRLGRPRWDHLRAVVSMHGPGDVLVHGWFGLGNCAIQGPSSVHAMIGEEIGMAPPGMDVGFLIGQLTEIRAFVRPQNGGATPDIHALLDGYGPAPTNTRAWSALGILLHLNDYSRYVSCDPAVAPLYADLAATVLDDCSTTAEAPSW
ncbi:hypothetical protein HNR23_004750 [Nocardiopsis mwathae]|uniref:Uncharacterized protein n=1 Tax=Nocardiopsis mwathae TaxID=1472723 RepID=A0A7W9YMG3_9ACTN|nr:hypothetical protein [Nocardiopsis mwathae]MBB6174690.1 hypothetical protein [Nocardiopsis mwathae]